MCVFVLVLSSAGSIRQHNQQPVSGPPGGQATATTAQAPNPAAGPHPEPVERPPVEAVLPAAPSQPDPAPAPSPLPRRSARQFSDLRGLLADRPRPQPRRRPTPPRGPIPSRCSGRQWKPFCRQNLRSRIRRRLPVPLPRRPARQFSQPALIIAGWNLDSKHSRPGERFVACLDDPVVSGGRVVVPKGTAFEGHVFEAESSGWLGGRAYLGVKLDSSRLQGRTYAIVTAAAVRASTSHRKRNLAIISGGVGTGAAIGVSGGGGVAAAIGAGGGVAAGTTAAFITGRKSVKLPVETPLLFSLRGAVAWRLKPAEDPNSPARSAPSSPATGPRPRPPGFPSQFRHGHRG